VVIKILSFLKLEYSTISITSSNTSIINRTNIFTLIIVCIMMYKINTLIKYNVDINRYRFIKN
jgi:hypothetical protein